MGSEQSGVRTEEDFLKEFEEIRRESDFNFGSVIIFRSLKNPRLNVLVKEKIFLAEDELNRFLVKARARAGIKGSNVAPLIEVILSTDKKLCSTTYKCWIGYEYQERTLEKLLRQRKTYENEESQNLSEEDAWGIMNDLVRGLKSYADSGYYHGDLQPSNIFVLNDKTLKVIDTCYMNDFDNAFNRRYIDFTYKSPFGPQAMAALSLGPNYATFDREKNDIWSLGICTLVALTNEDFNIFYDWTNQEIHFDLIQARLRKVSNMGYPSEFIKILKLTLEKEEYKRASLHELLNLLNRNGYEQYHQPQPVWDSPQAYTPQANNYNRSYSVNMMQSLQPAQPAYFEPLDKPKQSQRAKQPKSFADTLMSLISSDEQDQMHPMNYNYQQQQPAPQAYGQYTSNSSSQQDFFMQRKAPEPAHTYQRQYTNPLAAHPLNMPMNRNEQQPFVDMKKYRPQAAVGQYDQENNNFNQFNNFVPQQHPLPLQQNWNWLA